MSIWENIPLLNELSVDTRLGIARVVVVVGVLLLFWLLRQPIVALITRPLRMWSKRTETEIDDALARTIGSITSYIILAIIIATAALLLDLSGPAQAFFMKVAVTFASIAVLRLVYAAAMAIIKSPRAVNNMLDINLNTELQPLARVATKFVLFAVGLLIIAQIWNMNLAGIIAGIGIAGLAVSLAAKELLDDALGFALILSDDPFDIGDYVISPHGEGIIEKIGLRATRIRQLNQGLRIIPNHQIANDPLTNWSRLEQRWFNFYLGITYDATADQIEELSQALREMLGQREAVDEDKIIVYFTEYGDSSLNVLIRCYINIQDWAGAKAERHEVNLEIMRIVDEMGMSIAFPTRTLHLEQVPPAMISEDNVDSVLGEKKAEEHVLSASTSFQERKHTRSVKDPVIQEGASNNDGQGSADHTDDYTDYDDDGE